MRVQSVQKHCFSLSNMQICQKMKNARAKRAKILFFIVKYANLWGFCHHRRRGCLSSLVSHRETQSEGFVLQAMRLCDSLPRVKLPRCRFNLAIYLKGESALCKLNGDHCQSHSSPRKRA